MSTTETNGTQIDPIELPAWRKAAIRRIVQVYDGHAIDPEDTDGIVLVDYRASEADRAAALLELVEEIFPEAAERIRSHRRVGAKVLTAVCLVRLSEIALPGREFRPISNKEYAWRPKAKQQAPKANSTRKAPARQQANSTSSKAKPAQATRKAPTGPQKATSKAQGTSRASQASKSTSTSSKAPRNSHRADTSDAGIRKIIEQEEAKDRRRTSKSTPAAKPTSRSRTTSRRTTK